MAQYMLFTAVVTMDWYITIPYHWMMQPLQLPAAPTVFTATVPDRASKTISYLSPGPVPARSIVCISALPTHSRQTIMYCTSMPRRAPIILVITVELLLLSLHGRQPMAVLGIKIVVMPIHSLQMQAQAIIHQPTMQ